MLKFNKKVFLKFFTIYFSSVALLIIVFGGIYFGQRVDSIQNSSISQTQKAQLIQTSRYKIIAMQVLLLIVFGFISLYLSIKSITPLQKTLQKLDDFSKDIIHDINTPITSILLNLKLLEKKDEFIDNKYLNRIKKSAQHIQEIQNNLTVLLQENNLKLQKLNLVDIIQEVVNTHKKIYPNIVFKVDEERFLVEVNPDAINQVITNLISNACKYNHKNGIVKIYSNANTLFVEDFGVGIKNPKEVFTRAYKEQIQGNGIGLDIVKRLCDAMNVKVSVKQKNSIGSIFILEF